MKLVRAIALVALLGLAPAAEAGRHRRGAAGPKSQSSPPAASNPSAAGPTATNPCAGLLTRRTLVVSAGAAVLAGAGIGLWYFLSSSTEAQGPRFKHLDPRFDAFDSSWDRDETPGPPIRIRTRVRAERLNDLRIVLLPELHDQRATRARRQKHLGEVRRGESTVFVEGRFSDEEWQDEVRGIEARPAILLSSIHVLVQQLMAWSTPEFVREMQASADGRQQLRWGGEQAFIMLDRLAKTPELKGVWDQAEPVMDAAATNETRKQMVRSLREIRRKNGRESQFAAFNFLSLTLKSPKDGQHLLGILADAVVNWAEKTDPYVFRFAPTDELKRLLRQRSHDRWRRTVDHGYREHWMARNILEGAIIAADEGRPTTIYVHLGAAHAPGLYRILRQSLRRSGVSGVTVTIDETLLEEIENEIRSAEVNLATETLLDVVRGARARIRRAVDEP